MRVLAAAVIGVALVTAFALRAQLATDADVQLVLQAASPLTAEGLQPAGVAPYMLRPGELGDAWALQATGVPPADAAVFLESASASYVGPSGARVLLHVYRVLPSRAAIQRSWEDVGAVFDDVRYGFGVYGQIESVNAPSSPCVDVRRVGGADDVWNMAVGITMCAVDPDIIILAAVSGSWDGLTGVAASDAVAQRAGDMDLGIGGVTQGVAPGASPVAATPLATPVLWPFATPVAGPLATPIPATPQVSSESEDRQFYLGLNGFDGGAIRDYESASPSFFSVAAYSFFVFAFESPESAEAAVPLLSQRILTPPTDPAEPDFSALRPVSFPEVKDGVVALGGEVELDGISGTIGMVFIRDGRYVYGIFAGGLAADVFGEMDALVEALPDDPESADDDLLSLLPELDDMPPGFFLESEETLL